MEKDIEYVNGIRECVQLAKVTDKDVEDYQPIWDLIKMELRGYTQKIKRQNKDRTRRSLKTK